jgi:Domain of unknown function (DUF4845)
MVSKLQSTVSQRGVSLLGMLVVAGTVGSLFVVGAQVVPTVIEYKAIEKAAKKAASEGATVAEVRSIFDKSAQIDMISSVKSQDLEVTKEGEKIIVSFAYTREIHLAGPANLLLKYEGKSK